MERRRAHPRWPSTSRIDFTANRECGNSKSWLFVGSDDHANAAANVFSLVASCKLHTIDPEQYLAEVIHLMPYGPHERYLELAPKYWHSTRARIDPNEIAHEHGPISVPEPLSAEQKSAPG